VIAHLLLPPLLHGGVPPALVRAVLMPALAVPFAFWALARVHFDDDFRLGPRHMVLLMTLVGAGYLSWLVGVERVLVAGPFAPPYHRFWLALPKILPLAMVVHALLRVYVGAGSDLLVPRVRARYLLLAAAGTYIFVELLGEALVTGSESEQMAERVHSLAALLLVLAVAFVSLRIAPEILRPDRPVLDSPPLDPALGERLQRIIEVDGIFREEGLTIGGLADRLGVPELSRHPRLQD
jgi:hypothetical protein